jgi:ribosomal protein S6
MLDTENDVRIYELGYWFVPTIAEDALEDQVADLTSKLTSKGAVVISEEKPYLRELAYEMCKVIQNKNYYFTEGYFGWIKFEIDPVHIDILTKELQLDPSIIRPMIIQTVRENTVYTKRPTTLKRDEDETETESETQVVTEEAATAEVVVKAPVEVTTEAQSEVTVEETTVDDITIIEGLGPKAAEALIAAGIDTFAKLASATKEEIDAILEASPSKVQHLDATTWGKQASLAAEGKMDELKALQEELNNGKEV